MSDTLKIKEDRIPVSPVLVKGLCPMCNGELTHRGSTTCSPSIKVHKYHCFGCGSEMTSMQLFPRIEFQLQITETTGMYLDQCGKPVR